MSEEAKIQQSEAGEANCDAGLKPPRVFISYSHDTPAHKKWVGELASKLVKKGVEVVLDQWDLGLGDDVPKFMERAVSEADRVLMICTETYVRKADDGKGGVGYEAMVVTGELVKDLGTAKFIPIVRQESGGNVLPKCVGTRVWVNLSEGQNVEEQLETLLRELHNAPKLPKPALGKNPYATEAAKGIPLATPEDGIILDKFRDDAGTEVRDVGDLFATGLGLTRRDDLMGWRKLVQKTRQETAKNLVAWRAKYESVSPVVIEKLPHIVSEGAAIYSPLISLAVAGAVSGNNKFSNQAAILDELKNPANWNPAGFTYLAEVPSALTFTFQAVHGAACLFSGQLMKAIQLSRARLRGTFRGEADVLFKQPELMGWPHSFGERSEIAWNYLVGLFEKWSWLNDLFGSKEEYEASLHAYYLGLHIQELGSVLASGDQSVLESRYYRPLVPVQGIFFSSNNNIRAYRMLIHDPIEVRAIWRTLGVKDTEMAKSWEQWLNATCRVFTQSYRLPRLETLLHRHLFDDLRPEDNKS
ncbi:MAG: toll/interleukin-1 receptor domain-containing protein [Verrucomicrobiota bacterium]|jgi:hypothetical protein